MDFRHFDHLVTTRPHDISQIFISDLHLDKDSGLLDAFLSFLDDLSALSNLKALYILGDWFEMWLGDDSYLDFSEAEKSVHWITPIVNQLKKMRLQGCQTFVLTGNRDFLMRQRFCNIFAGEILSEPYFIEISDKKIRLEHGDALCTDDKSYQRLRKYTHKNMVQWWLLSRSMKTRIKIANKLRNTSKQANANKSLIIMDVNQTAVEEAVKECDGLIHGHTHRPDIHPLADDKIRYVLGDWRVENANTSYEKVTAVIGVVYQEEGSEVYDMVIFEWAS